MTQKQSLFFRFVLFLMGAGIVFLAFHLFAGNRELTRADKFMWVSIAGMYGVFFLPVFFSRIRIGNFSAKIPSLTLVWMGVFLYLPASIAVIVLLKSEAISYNTGLVIQAILVFLLALAVYLGYFANAHVGAVAGEEAALRRHLSEIKNKASLLALAVNALPAGYEAVQATLRRAIDDIKYITPVQNSAGADAELKIISALDTVKEVCGSVAGGARPATFEAEAEKLYTYVKERKLLRN
jgi:hypothetical protein